MYKNYIFDLYGTLVDIHTDEETPLLWKKLSISFQMLGLNYTDESLKKRYQELVLQEQVSSFEKAQKAYPEKEISIQDIEISLENVIRKLFTAQNVAIVEGQIQDIAVFFRSLSLEYIHLFEGAAKLLDRLHAAGKKIYLLSNAQRIFTEPEMRMLGIYDAFDGILYSSDIGFKKPSYLFYHALFDKFSLEKNDSVMIGNEQMADIEGATCFGIDSMYIHTNQSTPLMGELPSRCKRTQSIKEVF